MATLTYKIERSSWKSGIQRLVIVVGIKLCDAGPPSSAWSHKRVLMLSHRLGTGRVSGINTVSILTGTPPQPRSGLSGREIAMNRRVQGWRPST